MERKFDLDAIVKEFEQLEESLTDADIYANPEKLKTTMQRKKSLEGKVILYKKYLSCLEAMDEAREIFSHEKDADILELAKMQLTESQEELPKIEEELRVQLLPKDPNDEKNILLEVHPAAGGDEAGLFARELANAYLGFAKLEGFTVEILDESNIDGGGLKLLVAKISGFGAFSRFKFEGGTHRVQRIPETETKGRVHTSTVTVAVLPEVEAVDLVIRDEDLEITATRASGAGGQHVNKTSSAIRMVHKPSGLVVECQDERSQIQNKAKALAILRARLYAQEEEKRSKAIGEARLSQVGTGDRSEKIRTYNYPQDRVTDHRIGQNFSNLPGIMMGNLAPLIDAITIEEQTRLLEQAGG